MHVCFCCVWCSLSVVSKLRGIVSCVTQMRRVTEEAAVKPVDMVRPVTLDWALPAAHHWVSRAPTVPVAPRTPATPSPTDDPHGSDSDSDVVSQTEWHKTAASLNCFRLCPISNKVPMLWQSRMNRSRSQFGSVAVMDGWHLVGCQQRFSDVWLTLGQLSAAAVQWVN